MARIASQLEVILLTYTRLLFFGPLGTTFNENLTKVQQFSFKKIYLKMSFPNEWGDLSSHQLC